MITIKLLDARRGLNRKCEELFRDARIAELIYRFLCDGVEECEDAEPQRKKGKWRHYEGYLSCSECGTEYDDDIMTHCCDDVPKFCPNCGADMRGEENE